MAISKEKSLTLKSFIENIEPCFTPERNYIRAKTNVKKIIPSLNKGMGLTMINEAVIAQNKQCLKCAR